MVQKAAIRGGGIFRHGLRSGPLVGAARPLVHPRTQHMLLSARIEFHHMVSVDFFELAVPQSPAGKPLEALVEQ